MQALTVLGLETSCDETAAAVIRRAPDGRLDVLGDIIWSQHDAHALYKGVVPELAARAHVEKIDLAVAQAMREAGLTFADLDGVAATAGPGLIGGVMVGLLCAKAIAVARGLPLVAVNHLEGHALSPRITAPTPFPYLLLLVSGGHCQFLLVEDLGAYRRLGSTIDDAAGEAFDKTARVLGLGFPGGPAVERAAAHGDPARFDFPRPLLGRAGCDFSFAGLKTAVSRTAAEMGALSPQDQADLAASFQQAVVDVLVDRTRGAIALCGRDVRRLVVAGGVAANGAVRGALQALSAEHGWSYSAPPMRFCTDNAVMIALAGAERLARNLVDGLDAMARPRWPLDELAAVRNPTHTPGRKGAKA